MATQKDVAQRAGVSFITVSRVVNGLDNVKEETRLRVEEAIRELRYHPNHLGRALNQGKTGTWGVETPISIRSHFWGEQYLIAILDGIERRCRDTHQDLILSTEASENQSSDVLRLYRQKKVDGLVFIGFQRIAAHVIEEIREDHIPCVVIAERPDEPSVSWVDTQNFEAGLEAVVRLTQAGKNKIGFVVHDQAELYNFNVDQRLAGGLAELNRLGADKSLRSIFTVNDLGEAEGEAFFYRWQNLGRNRPDGLVFGNDLLAIGFTRAAIEAGTNIPQDVAYVGFDALPQGRWVRPQLASFAQPFGQMGYEAVKLLEQRCQKQAEPRFLTLPLTFQPGDTLPQSP
ncbi:MAG: LacI family DNA-binding transcriptional regulator [Spirochaetales bacterium]|nr:LacI family DNA-binding transcriptional regulator [Spirochaetales bacterium]